MAAVMPDPSQGDPSAQGAAAAPDPSAAGAPDPSAGGSADGSDPADTNTGTDPASQAQAESDPGSGAPDTAEMVAPVNPSTKGDFIPGNASIAGGSAMSPTSGKFAAEDDTVVSPEEQKLYDDFVTRCKLFINDPRHPLGTNGKPDVTKQSPRDVILTHLNFPGLAVPVALGRTTAQVCWLMWSHAKQNGVVYPPDVVFHGADEIMSDLYMLGVKAGIIKNPPPPNSLQEDWIFAKAKAEGAKFFGQNQINSGLDNKQEAQQFYQEQMKREAQSGQLDHWNPMSSFTPKQLADYISRSAQGKAALADQVKRPPKTIADFKKLGAPSAFPPSAAQPPAQPAPAQGAPAPDDGSQAPPDQGASAPPAQGGQ